MCSSDLSGGDPVLIFPLCVLSFLLFALCGLTYMNAVKLFLQRYDNQDTLDDDEILTPDRIIEIIHNAKKEQENKDTEN